MSGAIGKKQKVAVLGGGIGGLTAALELSATPEQRARFEITVYQPGWRLGGKCATGRNRDHGQRIEEHGIHGFLGSYFNALRLMKALYAEWAPPADHPLASFETAFPKEYSSFLWEWEGDRLLRWESVRAPNTLGVDMAPRFGTLASWLVFAATVLRQLARNLDAIAPDGALTHPQGVALLGEFDALIAAVEAAIPVIVPGEDHDGDGEPDYDWTKFATRLDVATATGADYARATAQRRQWLLLELLKTMLRGVRDDDLLRRGVGSIDGEDFKDWLRRHGASAELCASPLVLATINTTYQYPRGDFTAHPVMSAASWLQWTLRTLVSLGAPYYLFAAGSGDTIVAPAYEVLRRRGVRFAFFHRVRDVRLDAGGQRVESVVLDRQAVVKAGEYQPLVRVKGVAAWPDRPDLSQLEGADALAGFDFEAPYADAPGQSSVTLQAGADFDTVILAIPPAAIAAAAPSLCAARAEWQAVTTGMATTATQSAQIWLNRPVKAMDDPATAFHLAGNFMSGLHGHVDFGKFLAWEDRPEGARPEGLMFFSGVMRDPDAASPAEADALAHRFVREQAIGLLSQGGRRLLPRAAHSGNAGFENPFALDFSELFCALPPDAGQARFDDQYWRANLRPSERYTQSPPGTRALRIRPLDTGIANLTAAGDWVDTVLNVGSFEGAVIGGMLAARAIDETLPLEDIVGIAPTLSDRPERKRAP